MVQLLFSSLLLLQVGSVTQPVTILTSVDPAKPDEHVVGHVKSVNAVGLQGGGASAVQGTKVLYPPPPIAPAQALATGVTSASPTAAARLFFTLICAVPLKPPAVFMVKVAVAPGKFC